MTRVATPANEALLLQDAKHSTGTQVEAICRKFASVYRDTQRHPDEDKVVRTVTARDRDDGMVTLSAVLHPEEAGLVGEALTNPSRSRRRPIRRAGMERP